MKNFLEPNTRDRTKSTNDSDMNQIVSFIISFSTGTKIKFQDYANNILKSTIIKFMQENGFTSPGLNFHTALCHGNRLDINKTLLENNITDNSVVIFVMDFPSIIDIKVYQITSPGLGFNGRAKINQDTTLIKINVGGIIGFNLFGVLDGHGQYGHYISQFCRDYLIRRMERYACECKNRNLVSSEQIYNKLKNKFINYIIRSFESAHYEMTKQSNFDYYSSGTTCNLVVQLNKNLICANVVNSRDIIIYDTNGNTNGGIYQLSTDHIPDIPQEYQRIIASGGMVDKFIDQNGIKCGHNRIFRKGQGTPGIRISRSLGDYNAKSLGVTWQPDITEYYLNKNSKYMVIFSDGIWEVLNYEFVRDLGNIYYKKGQVDVFCDKLKDMTILNWNSKYTSYYRDDITVVCVYFS